TPQKLDFFCPTFGVQFNSRFLLLLIVRISILISKKGSEKSSDSIDFYYNLLKFKISKIA
ncbi:hypothetical protein, partial [uncultured Streptococcus sp.]